MKLTTQLPGRSFPRLSNLLIYAGLLVSCVMVAVLTVYFGTAAGVMAIAVMIGTPTIIYAMVNIKFGALMLLLISFFLIRVTQLGIDIPFGIIIDAFVAAVLLGVIFRKFRKNDLNPVKSVVGFFVWLWLIYNCLEFFNPIASREAWFYVIRTIAVRTLFFFIILEALDSIGFLKTFVGAWIALSTLAALYALFQEFHGLLDSEKAWLMRDEDRFKLFFNWGRFRVFSFLADPTVFGILMAFTGVFCLTFFNNPALKPVHRMLMVGAGGLMLLSTVYSGTRTAYAMIPAGIFFFALITFEKRILVATFVCMGLGAAVIFSDIQNLGPLIGRNPLERVRSAFRPNEDPSYLIRKENQERIKPFIHSHPFGSGVGSIGVWGERFTPNSALAGFAPDSTYVRVAVELGWIGLIIYCGFLAAVMITGIRNYYRIKNPGLRAFAAGVLAALFSIIVANYPQQAVIQIPNIFIFYTLIACIIKLPQLDEQLQTR